MRILKNFTNKLLGKSAESADKKSAKVIQGSKNATLAQLVEQGFRKAKVLGSNPRGGSKNHSVGFESVKQGKDLHTNPRGGSKNHAVGFESVKQGKDLHTNPRGGSQVETEYNLGNTDSMGRSYSRRARVEEKRNKRKAALYIFFTIAIIIVLVIFGIPLIIKLAAFLGEINQTSSPIEVSDNTPPAPPTLYRVPEYTNKKTLELVGSSETGAAIIFSLNGIQDEIVADSNGDFTYTIQLVGGENRITATAKDGAGNESQEASIYHVVYDASRPELVILTPNDGDNFYGSKERQIVIEGNTEVGVDLKINDRLVNVDEDGVFKYTATLNEGDNNFVAVATDKAGNQTEEGVTVHYWY